MLQGSRGNMTGYMAFTENNSLRTNEEYVECCVAATAFSYFLHDGYPNMSNGRAMPGSTTSDCKERDVLLKCSFLPGESKVSVSNRSALYLKDCISFYELS